MVFDQQAEPMVGGLDCVNVFRNSDDIWPRWSWCSTKAAVGDPGTRKVHWDKALYKLTSLRPMATSGDSLGEVWPRSERTGLRAPALLHMPWFSALTFLSAASDLVTAAAKFQVLSRSRGGQNSRQAELPWLAVYRGVQRTPQHRQKGIAKGYSSSTRPQTSEQFGGWMHLDQSGQCAEMHFVYLAMPIVECQVLLTSFMFIYYKTKEQNIRKNWGGLQATAEKPHRSCFLAQQQGHTLCSASPLGHLYPKWKPCLLDQKAPLNWLGYWLQNFCNSKYSNSRKSYALFWPLWVLGTQVA